MKSSKSTTVPGIGHTLTKTQKQLGSGLIIFAVVALVLLKLTNRRRRLREEILHRAGRQFDKSVEKKDSSGNTHYVNQKAWAPPQVEIKKKRRWNPFSDFTKILVKPATGVSFDQNEMKNAIAMIYYEYDWDIVQSEKGFVVFRARRVL